MAVRTPQKGLVREGLAGFHGVSLRRDALSLADEQVVRSINLDLHTMPGVLLARLGSRPLVDGAVGSGGGRVRRLARYGTRRYQVKGGNLFRDFVNIYSALSPNNVTTVLHYRPLNDTTTWTFIADDSTMQKDDGTTLGTWGMVAPDTAPTIAATSGGRLEAGEYTVVYTYVRKDGDSIAHESNPSPTSDTITLAGANNAIAVTAWTPSLDPQVTHVRFYRTAVDGVTPLFDVEVDHATSAIEYGLTHPWEDNDESTIADLGTVFTLSSARDGTRVCYTWEQDHALAKDAHLLRTHSALVSSSPQVTSGHVLLRDADSALGTSVDTDNDPPPLASWVTAFQEHAFLCRDAANPTYLYYSKRFRPEA
jgi:hypothetical protein